MQKLWSFLIFLLLLSPLYSQETFDRESIEVSTRSLKKANKQFQKELDKLTKKTRKRLERLYPDLPAENLDSLIQQNITDRKEELKTTAKDSVNSYLSTLKDDLVADLKETPENLPVADEIKESISKVQELAEMQGMLKDKDQLLETIEVSELNKLNREATDLKASFQEYKGEFENWDEALLEKVQSLPEVKKVQEEIQKKMAYKPLPEGYREKMEQFQTNDFVKEKLEAKAQEIAQLGETTLQEKFDQAQAKMTEAKQEFPSLESLEEAPKRYNPYKGQPFFERLIVGGNLQVNRQQPASFDAALNLTYPLTKRSAIGISAATRVFVEKVKPTQIKDNSTSLRSFLRHTFWKSFYLQGNYEFSRLRREDADEIALGNEWVQSALVGLGKQLNITKKVKMNFTLFYDFFFDARKSPNNQAWVMRLGFDLDKYK